MSKEKLEDITKTIVLNPIQKKYMIRAALFNPDMGEFSGNLYELMHRLDDETTSFTATCSEDGVVSVTMHSDAVKYQKHMLAEKRRRKREDIKRKKERIARAAEDEVERIAYENVIHPLSVIVTGVNKELNTRYMLAAGAGTDIDTCRKKFPTLRVQLHVYRNSMTDYRLLLDLTATGPTKTNKDSFRRTVGVRVEPTTESVKKVLDKFAECAASQTARNELISMLKTAEVGSYLLRTFKTGLKAIPILEPE